MRKLYENFHILHFQKRIVSAETIRGNTVCVDTCDFTVHMSFCRRLISIYPYFLLDYNVVKHNLLFEIET
jgi:hypothetical protein